MLAFGFCFSTYVHQRPARFGQCRQLWATRLEIPVAKRSCVQVIVMVYLDTIIMCYCVFMTNHTNDMEESWIGPTTTAQIRGGFRAFGENYDTKTGVHGSTVATKTVQVLATAFKGVKAWKSCSIVALKHLWAASRNQPQHDTVSILSTSPLALFFPWFSHSLLDCKILFCQCHCGAQVLLVRRQASFNKVRCGGLFVHQFSVLLKLRSSLLQGWKQPKSNLLEGRWARPDKHLGSSTFRDEVLHIDPPNLMKFVQFR